MKKKIVHIFVDLGLITAVFAITDFLMLKVFESENLWLELGSYLACYGVAFGAKHGIVHLWRICKRRKEH